MLILDSLNNRQTEKISRRLQCYLYFATGEGIEENPSPATFNYVVASGLYGGDLLKPCAIRGITITFCLNALTKESASEILDSMAPHLVSHGSEVIFELERRLAFGIPCDPDLPVDPTNEDGPIKNFSWLTETLFPSKPGPD